MLWGDVRFAVRGLVKRPGFALVAILTLALGIGANAAIFSVVHAVLLRPLPYADADRLVRVVGASTTTGPGDNLSPMDFLDLRSRAQRFQRIAAFNNYADATLTGAGEPERIAGTRVTADFFSVLQVAPLTGRDFRADDDEPGAPPVAIVSNGFWRRRFAADTSLVGRTVRLNSVPTEIVAVLPPSYRHPFPENGREPDVYVPFRLDRKENNRGGHYLQAIGRMKAGVTIAEAAADLRGIAADLERTYPDSNTGRTVAIEPLYESMVGATRSPLYILLGAVALVLLIACANLANLLLARSASRQREIAVRQALGASRVQLLRQLIVESLVLACAGGSVGVGIAIGAVRALAVLGAERIPRGDALTVDSTVLVFALGLSVVTGLLFGVAPALYATRQQPHDGLQQGGRSGEGPGQRGAQQALVACEVALALMLLVGAGLLIKSLWRLERVDPGFHAEQLLTLRTSLPLARYPEGDEIPFYERLEERLAVLPGIRAVGAINILPLSSDYSCDGFAIEGRPPYPPGTGPCAEHRSITPAYFEAMAIPLERGRAFTRRDNERAPLVAIINDAMARRFWSGQDPVGARIVYQKTVRSIVGVVGDVHHFGLDREAPFELYTPHAQQPSYHTMNFVIRTAADATAVVPMVRRELAAIDRDVPISEVRTMERMVADSTTEPRFRTVVLGSFAALAVLLSVVGVGGVIAFGVSRRTREIGVRIALGATGGRVISMIVRQGLVATAAGVVAGLAGALALTRVLSGLLFGVAPNDMGVFAAATATLLTAAAAASYIPARRAAAVEPTAALRSE